MSPVLDPHSVAGKTPEVTERCDLLVVGGGIAGLAAATEAARLGLSVILFDEHPLDPGLIGLDVPFRFGGRAGAAVQQPDRLVERLVEASPGIAAAVEAGVDVRLGACVWGLFANGPALRWMPGPVAAVADRERSWLVGFERAILAAGRRDVGLAFPGWDLAGVVGAVAAEHLIGRYGAFEGRRLVVLGSGLDALSVMQAANAAGLAVAAIVEVCAAAEAPETAAFAAEHGIPLLTGHLVAGCDGGPDGVTQARLRPVSGGPEETIACDTVVTAIGAAPVVDLADAAGALMAHDPARGGWVPAIDGEFRTSLPFLHAVGDAAGLWAGKTPQVEGVLAARAVARALGRAVPDERLEAVGPGPARAGREAWFDAQQRDPGLTLCLCEEVTLRELVGVQPPRYLGKAPPRLAARGTAPLAGLLGQGPPDQDQVKRLTRAGMGPCQGRRCREQVGHALARAADVPPGAIPLPSHRPPVRPLPLSVLADLAAAQGMRAHWDSWFGIAAQWVPFWHDEERQGIHGK